MKKLAKRINTARKGANMERLAVNNHIKNGAMLSARFASSKCKGILKGDVIAIYATSADLKDGKLVIQQFKNFAKKGNFQKEREAFLLTPFPLSCTIVREFIAKGD